MFNYDIFKLELTLCHADYKTMQRNQINKINNPLIHACFYDKKIRQKIGGRKMQRVATLAGCFQGLPNFQIHFSWMFLKLGFMFNIVQLEFPNLEFICLLNQYQTFP